MLKCPVDVRGRAVSGLEIRCPGLEVRLGVEEMQERTPGKHEQLGPREGEETTVRKLGTPPQKLKGQKAWGTVANRVTCYRKSP